MGKTKLLLRHVLVYPDSSCHKLAEQRIDSIILLSKTKRLGIQTMAFCHWGLEAIGSCHLCFTGKSVSRCRSIGEAYFPKP